MIPRSNNFDKAATVAPPSGAEKIPSCFPIHFTPSMSSSSDTLMAKPELLRIDSKIRKSPTATGTLSPYALVFGSLKYSAVFLPVSNARIMGAHPSDCIEIILGLLLFIQPRDSISLNAFHIPIIPVPPPVG